MKRIIGCAVFLAATLLCGMALAKTAVEILNEQPRTGNYMLSQIPGDLRCNGRVWYVNSQEGNSRDADVADGIHGTTMETPFSSIDFAISQCTASKGDVIIVAPTHTDANGFNLNIAGVSIKGQGAGHQRGTISLSGSGDDDYCIVTAANCTVENLRFVDANAGTLTTMFITQADDLTIRNCSFEEYTDYNGTTALTIGVADNDSDRLLVENCDFYLPTATNWAEAIKFAKDMTGVMIRNTRVRGDFSNAAISIPTAGNAQVDLLIDNCWLENHETGDHALEANGTGNRGVIRRTVFCTDGTYVDAGGLGIEPTCTTVAYGTDSDTVGWTQASLADDAITAAKIAADAITSSEIAANAIGSSELSISAADKIADQSQSNFDVNGPSAAASVGMGRMADHSVTHEDANGFSATASPALGRLSTHVKADIDANGFSATASPANGRIADQAQSHIDANGFSATASPANGRIADQVVLHVDANSTVLEKCVSKTQASPATGTIFSVSGACEILQLVGYVTVNMEGKANTLKLLVDPCTPAADTDLCVGGETNGDAAGTCYIVDGNVADALVQTTNGVVARTALSGSDLDGEHTGQTLFIVPASDIEVNLDNGTSTGTIIWYVRYRPLSPGAAITAD